MPIEPARWCTMVHEDHSYFRTKSRGNRATSYISRKGDTINISISVLVGFKLSSSSENPSEKYQEKSQKNPVPPLPRHPARRGQWAVANTGMGGDPLAFDLIQL